MAVKGADTRDVLDALRPILMSDIMKGHFEALEAALSEGISVSEYAERIGCGDGVSGFAPNSVSVALYGWLRHRGDFERMLTEVIGCGGDTDSVAAIAGGICGAEVGEQGIPPAWIAGISDWPRSTGFIRRLVEAGQNPLNVFWPAVLLRNFIFLVVVLFHGFRRLLPPY